MIMNLLLYIIGEYHMRLWSRDHSSFCGETLTVDLDFVDQGPSENIYSTLPSALKYIFMSQKALKVNRIQGQSFQCGIHVTLYKQVYCASSSAKLKRGGRHRLTEVKCCISLYIGNDHRCLCFSDYECYQLA